jgi:hypothetical protein
MTVVLVLVGIAIAVVICQLSRLCWCMNKRLAEAEAEMRAYAGSRDIWKKRAEEYEERLEVCCRTVSCSED